MADCAPVVTFIEATLDEHLEANKQTFPGYAPAGPVDNVRYNYLLDALVTAGIFSAPPA